jgi:hypothetical protein
MERTCKDRRGKPFPKPLEAQGLQRKMHRPCCPVSGLKASRHSFSFQYLWSLFGEGAQVACDMFHISQTVSLGVAQVTYVALPSFRVVNLFF